MFECVQCHASTPDECMRRHEAALALHNEREHERMRMHQAVDEIANRVALAGSNESIITAHTIQALVAESCFDAGALRIYECALQQAKQTREWREGA